MRPLSRAMIEMVDSGSWLARAFWWSAMVAEAIEREWIVNLGQRTAVEQVGHLFCELFLRLKAIGETSGSNCEMLLTQIEPGDTTGLSTVHVNRTSQELRARDLIALRHKTLSILDFERLKQASLLTPNYLHLDHSGEARSAGPA